MPPSPWDENPTSARAARRQLMPMKKPKHWSQPTTRTHESRDDRARTWAGKTADSKVRSEGRHLATVEADTETKVRHQATEAKTDQTSHGLGG
jgi:hypothetical protein